MLGYITDRWPENIFIIYSNSSDPRNNRLFDNIRSIKFPTRISFVDRDVNVFFNKYMN
jgi:hypothetical protein